MRKTIADYCFIFGAVALFFFSANLLTATLFLFHGSEAVFEVWIVIIATIFFGVFLCRRYFEEYLRPLFYLLLALIIIFAGSLALAGRFYDISYDGQTYQQEGVIQLANGWNPIYQNLDPAVIGIDQQWINYYPKGIWIVESYFYLLTHALQTAKGANLILIPVAGALAYAALADAELLDGWSAFAVSGFIAVSPVAISQSLNFYVDGDLYAFFVSFVALSMSLYAKKRPFAFAALFFTIVILINVKITCLVDAGLLLVVFFVAFAPQSDSK